LTTRAKPNLALFAVHIDVRFEQAQPADELTLVDSQADEVPTRNPGTVAFVPVVDGDLLHGYPVPLARGGRTHPVPLIIGTNKHEAALFRLMRSPLLPITPRAITSMFNDIAAEQPDMDLPTVDELGSSHSRYRGSGRGVSIASDVGFRMPSVWLAEGHNTVAPVYLYRFDYATPIMKVLLGALCRRVARIEVLSHRDRVERTAAYERRLGYDALVVRMEPVAAAGG
jgi:carboxylesterase type B